MGFFKRKKDEEVKIQLEREALDKLNGNTTNVFHIDNNFENNANINTGWQISGKMKAPHTITAEELNAKAQKNNNIQNHTQDAEVETIPMEKSDGAATDSPTNFLYQKMMQSRANASKNSVESKKNEEPADDNSKEKIAEIPLESTEKAKTPPLDINAAIDDLKNFAKSNTNSEESVEPKFDNASSNDTVLDDASTPPNDENVSSEIVKNETEEPVQSPANDTDDLKNIGANAEERRTTLLARCNAFLEDATGPLKANSEKYKLESVESILKDFEERAAERVNKKFSSNYYSSTTTTSPATVSNETLPLNEENGSTENAVAENNVTENTIVFDKASLAVETLQKEPEPQELPKTNEVKHIFTASVETPNTTSDVEDISSTKILEDISSHSAPDNSSALGNTAVFPIAEQNIDNSNQNSKATEDENDFQNSDNANYLEDYESVADRQKILNSLLRKKRVFLFKSLFSFVALIVGIITLAPISDSLQLTTSTTAVLDVLVCVIISILNFNILPNILTLFNKKQKSALPAALSLIIATVFSILNLIFKGNLVGISSVAALSVFSYNLANKNFYSKTIKNFNLIANSEDKKAVSIIQNKNATKAIVGNSIDGSALICYGGETTNIHNFLKYTYCKNPISAKIQKLSFVSIIISLGLAAASLILSVGNLLFAFYVFATAICFSSLPAVYHIVSLTVNSANKRLNHYDAMITGYRAADELELCNGIAISSNSLFPDGTIRLVDMKLLSPNPFDQSMLDAAAISSAINSPIAGIFKQIDTSKTYKISAQEVDSVIYEEKMGISGWVNDRRVFVGNRDLLIAHGFTGLPPAELDKKIMRKGYFPIYIASDNILCALLIVKYEPDEDIIYEIQRLANTGTTILVDNCDPNINSKMLADYFELYDETIFVMSKQGSDCYKTLITHKEHRRAGAAYTSRIEGFLATLTASINIKKHISRMVVFYVLSIVLGLLALTACIFTSLVNYITPLNIMLIQILFTVITLLPTVLRKP